MFQAADVSQCFDQTALMGLPKRVRTNLVNSLSGFKSANLLGTADAHGVTNLALISSLFHVGANPPLLGMLIRPHTVPRHSLENLQASGVYTINAIVENAVDAAHQCSAKYPQEQSEFLATGLEPAWSSVWSGTHQAPYVANSPLQIGLVLKERHTLACNATELVVGEIVEVRMQPGAMAEDGYLDLEALGVVCISGLDGYHTTRALGRRAYARP